MCSRRSPRRSRSPPIVYGKGVVLGKMISANITMTRNSDPLYADDAIAESDNSITGGTISLNLDDIDDAARVAAFGVLKEGEPDSETYSETGDPTPYGGLGYIRVRRLKGRDKLCGILGTQVPDCHQHTDSANTKGSTITWQTPTVDGTIIYTYIYCIPTRTKRRDSGLCFLRHGGRCIQLDQ